MRFSSCVLVLVVMSLTSAQAEEKPSALERHLARTATHQGPVGWDGVPVGTSVEHKTTTLMQPAAPGSKPVTGHTRLRFTQETAAGRVIERASRGDATQPWRAFPGRARSVSPRKPQATRSVQGPTKVSVAGVEHTCQEIVWRVVRRGAPVDLVRICVHPKHGVLRWIHYDGNWTSTYTATRLAVPFKLGSRTLICREFQRVAVAPNMNARMESIELWCAAVPDWIVRAKTTSTMAMGGRKQTTSQTRELTALVAPKPKAAEATKKASEDPAR